MQHIARESYKKAPRVRVWLELGGKDGIGAVEVGQSTTLGNIHKLNANHFTDCNGPYYAIPKIGVRAVLPGSIGVRIIDCSALDGLGESSQKLLDERGCPVDEQVCTITAKVLILSEFNFYDSIVLVTEAVLINQPPKRKRRLYQCLDIHISCITTLIIFKIAQFRFTENNIKS